MNNHNAFNRNIQIMHVKSCGTQSNTGTKIFEMSSWTSSCSSCLTIGSSSAGQSVTCINADQHANLVHQHQHAPPSLRKSRTSPEAPLHQIHHHVPSNRCTGFKYAALATRFDVGTWFWRYTTRIATSFLNPVILPGLSTSMASTCDYSSKCLAD